VCKGLGEKGTVELAGLYKLPPHLRKIQMKKLLLSFICATLSLAAMAWQETAIVSSARGTGTTVTSSDFYGKPTDRAIHVITEGTDVASSPTVVVTLEGKTPTGAYYTILASASTPVTSTLVHTLKVGNGLPVTTNLSANDMIPPIYRVKAVVAGTGTATFSISINGN
jgi:hypothetical protein